MQHPEYSLFERVLTYVEIDEGRYWNEGIVTGILYRSDFLTGEDWAYQITFYEPPSFGKHLTVPVNEFMSSNELSKLE